MSLRIAVIPYLNCAPFYWNKSKEPGKCVIGSETATWVPVTPKHLGELGRTGGIDAGPISLADSFQLEEKFEPLSDLGICVKNSAKSVLLFSQEKIESLSNSQIGLTTETSTSSHLLQAILSQKYGLKPCLQKGFSPSDSARLLIGDTALKATLDSQIITKYPLVYDLAEEWKEWQGLSFVFARWMIKRGIQEDQRNALTQNLLENLRSSLGDPVSLLRWYKEKEGWNHPQAQAYLRNFCYHLGEEEKESIRRFREFWGHEN